MLRFFPIFYLLLSRSSFYHCCIISPLPPPHHNPSSHIDAELPPFSSHRSSLSSTPDLRRLTSRSPAAPTPLSVVRRVCSGFELGSSSSSDDDDAGRRGRLASDDDAGVVSDDELRDLARLILSLGLEGCQVDGNGERSCEGNGDGNVAVDGEGGSCESDDDADGLKEETILVSGRPQEEAGEVATLPRDDALDDTVREASPDTQEERPDSPASFHLSKKHISQQLRSKSQLSAPSEATECLTPEAWSFHRRERSNCGTSMSHVNSIRSRHIHNTSDSGVESAHVPVSWGRLTVCCDSSSSIYSRPTSPQMSEPYEIPADLAAVADWPLTGGVLPSALPSTCVQTQSETGDVGIRGETHITIVEPDLPARELEETTSAIEEQDGSHLSTTPQREPSHKSTSSSTTKSTRFLERFSPPKKLVRKRRSIFKFLRAGSRRQQTRSVSTPVLCSPSLRPCLDGPADDSELLTVQYELVGTEGNATRSVSLNNLPTPTVNEAQGAASSPDLRRKSSLADYERHLSVVGDNRRRPSAREPKRLSHIEEDDQHDPSGTKNTFSLYSEMQETDPLMTAALQRQMQEKALFRSASKRSVPISEGSSLSFFATSWDEPSQTQPQSPERDPFDNSVKRPGDHHLSPPRTPVGSRSRTSSFSNQKQADGKKPIVLQTPSSISRGSTASRIGTSLDSWTRFPSHTRGERCASASAADNVRARDFAFNDTGAGKDSDEPDPFSLSKRVLTKRSTKSSKKSLPKSRSATFGSFVRYYNNLFTSSPGFHGKGRRTSVAAGGTLRHPELEMLSPVLPGSEKSDKTGSLTRIKEHHEEGLEKMKKPLLKDHQSPTRGGLAAATVAFRGNSLFASPSHSSQKAGGSNDPANTTQSDDPEDPCTTTAADLSTSDLSTSDLSTSSPAPFQHNHNLDGTVETTTDSIKKSSSPPSKAQAWSDSYKDCLITPPSPASQPAPSLPARTKTDAELMPPPTLKPAKHRSPHPQSRQNSSTLDPSTAAIRRFPSVTVVDDRKGHWRSVSFISVKSGKSVASSLGGAGGFVRESSNDLLVLMERRERKEREKLLGGVV